MNRQPKNLLTLALILSLMASGSVRGENFTEGLPPPADTTPTYPPPPPAPAQDRKDGNGAAIAMAAIGAAMAGMSCAMMLAEAKKAEAAGDSSQAAMLRMMGLQQCAQAAQNALSAAQNGKGKDAMTQAGTPGQPKFADLPQGAAKKDAAPAASSSNPKESAEQSEASGETVDPVEFAGLPDGAFKSPPGTEPGTSGGISGDITDGYKKLDPIDRASVQFDDSSKGGGKTVSTPLGASSGLVAAGAAFNLNGKGLGAAPEIEGRPDGKSGVARRGSGGIDSFGGGHDSASTSSSSSAGGMDIAALMAQLQGKAPGAEAAGSIPDIIRLDKKEADGPSVNIFQYAGFRYRKAQRDDGLVAKLRGKLTATAVVEPVAEEARAPASVPPAPKAVPGKPGKAKISDKRQAKVMGKPAVLSRR